MMARHQGIVKRGDRIVGCDQRAVDEDDVTARAALVIVQPVALGRIDVMLARARVFGVEAYVLASAASPSTAASSRFTLIPVREKGLT